MDLGAVCLSLPVVVNREGVARVIPIQLNQSEQQALRASAEILKQYIAVLEGSKAAVA